MRHLFERTLLFLQATPGREDGNADSCRHYQRRVEANRSGDSRDDQLVVSTEPRVAREILMALHLGCSVLATRYSAPLPRLPYTRTLSDTWESVLRGSC